MIMSPSTYNRTAPELSLRQITKSQECFRDLFGGLVVSRPQPQELRLAAILNRIIWGQIQLYSYQVWTDNHCIHHEEAFTH